MELIGKEIFKICHFDIEENGNTYKVVINDDFDDVFVQEIEIFDEYGEKVTDDLRESNKELYYNLIAFAKNNLEKGE